MYVPVRGCTALWDTDMYAPTVNRGMEYSELEHQYENKKVKDQNDPKNKKIDFVDSNLNYIIKNETDIDNIEIDKKNTALDKYSFHSKTEKIVPLKKFPEVVFPYRNFNQKIDDSTENSFINKKDFEFFLHDEIVLDQVEYIMYPPGRKIETNDKLNDNSNDNNNANINGKVNGKNGKINQSTNLKVMANDNSHADVDRIIQKINENNNLNCDNDDYNSDDIEFINKDDYIKSKENNDNNDNISHNKITLLYTSTEQSELDENSLNKILNNNNLEFKNDKINFIGENKVTHASSLGGSIFSPILRLFF